MGKRSVRGLIIATLCRLGKKVQHIASILSYFSPGGNLRLSVLLFAYVPVGGTAATATIVDNNKVVGKVTPCVLENYAGNGRRDYLVGHRLPQPLPQGTRRPIFYNQCEAGL